MSVTQSDCRSSNTTTSNPLVTYPLLIADGLCIGVWYLSHLLYSNVSGNITTHEPTAAYWRESRLFSISPLLLNFCLRKVWSDWNDGVGKDFGITLIQQGEKRF